MKRLMLAIGLALLCVPAAFAQTGWVDSLPSDAVKVKPYQTRYVNETVIPFQDTKKAVADDNYKWVTYDLKPHVVYFYVFDEGTANEQIFEDGGIYIEVYFTETLPITVDKGKVTFTDYTLTVYSGSAVPLP